MAAVPSPRPGTARTRERYRRLRKHLPAYLFIAPNFAGVLVFVAFPVLFAIFMSLQDWNGADAPRFVWLSNFNSLLTDPMFWHSLRITTVYTLLTVPAGIVVGLGLAILLNQRARGLVLFRTAMFIPVVTSAAAVAVIWKWIFDYDNGLINDVLSLVNQPQIPWLTDPAWALTGLAIIGVWKNVGLMAIILVAALQSVPEPLLEAAAVDGAGAWRRFWHIALPLIMPALLFVTVISVINSFQVLDQAYLLTDGPNGQGGPDYGTLVLNLLIFQTAFQQNRYGAASALALVLFIIIFVITLVQLRVGRSTTNAASGL